MTLEHTLADCEAEAERLAPSLAKADRWTLTHTLMWIGRRTLDVEAIRQERFWSRQDLGFPVQGGTIVGLVRSWLTGGLPDGETPSDRAPDIALRHALAAGDVVGYGVRDRRGSVERIPATEWDALTFGDRADLPPGACAISTDPANPTAWRSLRFDRASVVAAFPAAGGDWRVQPNMELKDWLRVPAVYDEAERQQQAGLVPASWGLPNVLHKMCEGRWTHKTIRNAKPERPA